MNEIALDKNVYDELMAVSRWYDEMPLSDSTPNFEAGDRFHENVFNFRMSCIPEDVVDFEDSYVDYFELQNDELFAVVGQWSKTGPVEGQIETRLKFVVKG